MSKGENIPDQCYWIFILACKKRDAPLRHICLFLCVFTLSCSVVPGAASLNWLNNSSSSWWGSSSSTTFRSSLSRMFSVHKTDIPVWLFWEIRHLLFYWNIRHFPALSNQHQRVSAFYQTCLLMELISLFNKRFSQPNRSSQFGQYKL